MAICWEISQTNAMVSKVTRAKPPTSHRQSSLARTQQITAMNTKAKATIQPMDADRYSGIYP